MSSIILFASDSSSERATSILDYQTTCANFVSDISRDYMDWVDRYNLGEPETERRKSSILSVVKVSTDWIYNYGDTIKKVDIVMNDAVNKMAENTAGYPFVFDVLIEDSKRYAKLRVSDNLRLRLVAVPRESRRVRLGKYQKDQLFLVNSSSPVSYSFSSESMVGGDTLNDYVIVNIQQCHRNDLISITAVVEELGAEGHVTESRGSTTLILLI